MTHVPIEELEVVCVRCRCIVKATEASFTTKTQWVCNCCEAFEVWFRKQYSLPTYANFDTLEAVPANIAYEGRCTWNAAVAWANSGELRGEMNNGLRQGLRRVCQHALRTVGASTVAGDAKGLLAWADGSDDPESYELPEEIARQQEDG